MRPVPVVFLLFPFSDQLTSSQCQFSTWLKKKSAYLKYGLGIWLIERDSVETYTCGPWRTGNRTRSRCASGRAWSGDLGSLVSNSFHRGYINPCSPSRVRARLGLGEKTYRNDGTECASCCGAYRSWTFPSLHPRVNQTHPQNIRIKRFPGTPRKSRGFAKKVTRRG